MQQIRRFSKKTWKILKDAKSNFQQGEPIIYSAAIAFFTIFSMPAILIVITLVATLFFPQKAVRVEIIGHVEELISAKVGEQLNTVLENITAMPLDFWSILIGFVIVLQSASIMFFTIQKALNSVWNVRVRRGVSIWRVLKHKLGPISIVIGLGLLLVVSLMLNLIITIYDEPLRNVLEEYFTPAVQTVNTVFFLIVVFSFFTSIHMVLPDAKIEWKDALTGGGITTILFLFGKQLINFALENIRIAGFYAAAGSLVILLLWVFYSSIILMLGAEVTKAYANNHGRKIEPSSIAEKYRKESELT